MKKLILSLVGVVAVGAAILHYFPGLVEPLLQGTPVKGLVATSKPVYQWRDVHGQWQVTDQPPADGVAYETKRYPLDANLLPSPDRGAE